MIWTIRSLLRRLRGMPPDRALPSRFFTAVYEKNLWRGKESRSGMGSEGSFGEQKVRLFADLMKSHCIESVLDLGCGDFYWMRKVASNLERYHGVDVVEPLIQANIERFGSRAVTFQCLYITSEQEQTELDLQPFDLVVCIDVFGHLLNEELDRVLTFLLTEVEAKYLLVTNRRDARSELYLRRPKSRREGVNVQAHRVFQQRRLAPVWQREAEYPGDLFELYEIPVGTNR